LICQKFAQGGILAQAYAVIGIGCILFKGLYLTIAFNDCIWSSRQKVLLWIGAAHPQAIAAVHMRRAAAAQKVGAAERISAWIILKCMDIQNHVKSMILLNF
jgi:hypothetical protein